MKLKNLLIRIDEKKHKEIKRIALERNTNIQKIFKKYDFDGFINRIIKEEK